MVIKFWFLVIKSWSNVVGNHGQDVFPIVIKFLGNHVGCIPHGYQVSWSIVQDVFPIWLSSFLVYCVGCIPHGYQVSWYIVQDVLRSYSPWLSSFLVYCVGCIPQQLPRNLITWSIGRMYSSIHNIKFLGLLCRMYSPWLSSFLVYCVGCIPHGYQVSW